MHLSEQLLQYLWLHRMYNTGDLKTESGETLQILKPGIWNKNAGPDFLNGKVKVGDTVLAGHIEMHLKASDWIKHGHAGDPRFKNLILHVVYESDLLNDPLLPQNVPTLVLKGRIPGLILEKYSRLMLQGGHILCKGQLDHVRELTWISWKDRLLVERWQQKTTLFSEWMEENKNDWAQTFYRALARNFGLPVNGAAFEAVACSLPLKLLARYKNRLSELEALLLGQAGMLKDRFKDDYPRALQKTYHFLQKKHHLTPVQPHLWKWARMRPSAFPPLRLAQFAALINHSSHLFSTVLETTDVRSFRKLFQVEVSPYWDTHYRFEKISARKKKKFGKSMIDNILINTVCPMLAMYDQFQLKGHYLDRAFQWMKTLPPENNRYTREWEKAGESNQSAWDSQALLQLFKNYCLEKKCLECAVGAQLLKN